MNKLLYILTIIQTPLQERLERRFDVHGILMMQTIKLNLQPGQNMGRLKTVFPQYLSNGSLFHYPHKKNLFFCQMVSLCIKILD